MANKLLPRNHFVLSNADPILAISPHLPIQIIGFGFRSGFGSLGYGDGELFQVGDATIKGHCRIGHLTGMFYYSPINFFFFFFFVFL